LVHSLALLMNIQLMKHFNKKLFFTYPVGLSELWA